MIIRPVLIAAACMVAVSTLPAYGDVISSASITGGDCAPSQTVSGAFTATASVSCLSPSSSASAGLTFDVGSPSLSMLTFSDSAAPFNVATSSASFDFSLVVLGGSGTGFLALDYLNNVSGSNDPQASANAGLTVLLNGGTDFSGRVCGNMPGSGGPFSCSNPIPVGFNFTYGTPFQLVVTLTGVAGGGLGGSNISGNGTFSYTILSSTGQPNPNAALNVVPEPGSGYLVGLILLVLFAGLNRMPRLQRRRTSAMTSIDDIQAT